MSGPALDRCATCGEPAPDGPTCPHCGRSLRVDVLLRAPITDPKSAFKLARALAGQDGVTLGFADLRAALQRGGLLMPALPRGIARGVMALLGEAGAQADCHASDGARVPARRLRRWGAVLLGAAVLLAGAGGAWSLLRGREPAVPAPAPSGQALPASPAPALAATGALAATSEAAPSVASVVKRVTPATATISCQGKTGAGFFVDGERLLTNAHVVCGEKVELQVTTGDGRSLLGRVVAQDAWLDWAVVHVPGAGVGEPIALGDSTALSAADPVVIIGAPKGLAGTVHEGKVSFVGRNSLGVAYVQVNAAVNPGNSGGPLLDASGRAVGIVSLKIAGADGMGLALPVEYARAGLTGLPAPDVAAAARFADLRRRVEAEDEAEVARMRADLARPVLLSAAPAGSRILSLVVMQRWAGRPGRASLVGELHRDGQLLCRTAATVTDWIDLQKKVKELSDPLAERRVAWLLRHQLLADVHAGATLASLEGCPDAIAAGARLKLEGTDGESAWAALPAISVNPAEEEARRARDDLQQAQRADERRQTEQAWREAFVQMKAIVAKLQAERDRMKRALSDQPDALSIQEAREHLPTAEAALRRAQEELDDLERKASAAGVPREWR